MTSYYKGILCTTALLFSLSSIAQNGSPDLLRNRAALREYTIGELERFQQTDRKQFNKLNYYYTASFEASLIDCDTCSIALDVLINRDLFNVRDFEQQRQQSDEVSFVYNENYLITLKSIQEVESAEASIDQGPELRELPVWANSGNDDLDYANYKQELHEWIMDFPELYRSRTSNGELLVLRFNDFVQLEPERRSILLSDHGNYLIVD